MVVLALPPETVGSETIGEVTQQPAPGFHRGPGQLLVLEPGGDRGKGCGVPGLTVGEALIELTDQAGGRLGHAIDAG